MRIVGLFILLHVVDGLATNGEFNLTWASLESAVNSALRSVVKSYFPIAARIISEANVSSSCEMGLMTYTTALQRSKLWAFKMIDATSKIPSGFLSGITMDFGEYDQCLEIRVPEISRTSSKNKENFRGQYCTIRMEPDMLYSAVRRLEDSSYVDSYGEPPEIVKYMFSKTKSKLRELKIFIGVCIPSSCSQIDLQRISSALSNRIAITATVVDCHVDEPYVWPLHSALALSALVVLAAICSLGTIVDIMKRKRKKDNSGKETVANTPSNVQERTVIKILEAFSILTNSEKLMQSNDGSSAISCFHGVRFLSATWIIIGHVYIYPDEYKYYSRRNLKNFLEMSNLASKVIENFSLAVDTFFFISGFLLVYSTWHRMKKSDGKLDLFKFFIRKYMRMTPAICFAITLFLIMPVIDSGPLWHSRLNPAVENCQKTWWANVLYISNYFDMSKMCLDHTWYLSALMQFHILGVLLLMLFYRFRALGVILGLLFSAICLSIVLFQVVWENFGFPLMIDVQTFERFYEFMDKVYTKPQSHFTCYLVGMMVAYLLLKYKEKKFRLINLTLGWCCAVVLALFAVYGPSLSDGSRAFVVFYNVVQRPAWGLALGFLTYMCCSGYGGLVNRLLSHRILHPLSQLSFMIYLIHPLILIYRCASQRERIYFGQSEQVFIFFSLLLPSIFLAFIGCVTVEIPFQSLEKIIFKGSTKESKAEIKSTEDKPVNGEVHVLHL